MAFLSIEDARAYAHDQESKDEDILKRINAAEAYIAGACRADFPREDARAQMLGLLLVSDMTDERQLVVSSNSTQRLFVSSIIAQLKYPDVSKLDTSGERSDAP